jgi:hypothetical protein
VRICCRGIVVGGACRWSPRLHLQTDDHPKTLTTAKFKPHLEPCDSLSALLKLIFNLKRGSVETWAHATRTNSSSFQEDIAMSRSSYSSESCLLLSALTSSATRTCNLTRFSSPSRLNVIHGHHIHISRFILHLSLSFITPMIPGSLEGQFIQTRR